MSSFVVAGQADDPSFARAEYAAKEVQAEYPNIFVRYEMKHPDHWKAFINEICRTYDFAHYPAEFAGPLVWTAEGDLIGGSADFVQKICIEKFGIKDPPAVTDQMFKLQAADNLKQVKQQLHREQNGLPLAEKVEAAQTKASHLLCPESFGLQKQIVISGATVEVWRNDSLQQKSEEFRKAFGEGQADRVDPGLQICKVGQEQSHTLLLHHMPLTPKHVVLVPTREVREITGADEIAEAKAAEEAAKAAEAEAAAAAAGEAAQADGAEEVAAPAEANDEVAAPAEAPAEADEVPAAPAADLTEVKKLEIPAGRFRATEDEDLSVQDFYAAMELLLNMGGVATWTGVRGGSEYRHPLDTHIQVLPFPFHSLGESSPLRFPLDLYMEGALREGKTALSIFPFRHLFGSVNAGEGKTAMEFAKAAFSVYEKAMLEPGMGGPRQSRSIAFTTNWMLVMPLQPPDVSTPRHEAWLKFPPPHPCALCGLIVTPSIETGYPETATGPAAENLRLVSTRADEECIPEGTPEYDAAVREVRISSKILEMPAEIIGVWGLPS
eukprot:TRINITY_DN110863_c0_g1_i1.p1 TRINITY_DN110863_c0_g1~~TRINITY_DN110863_c0_g1_i1.p1  ORF type:complete len:552 (-),score=151.32 TRINITY_DN110863_c0_g1_i1:49-1704(-)